MRRRISIFSNIDVSYQADNISKKINWCGIFIKNYGIELGHEEGL